MDVMNFSEVKEPFVVDLKQNLDDRGVLYEVIHGSDEFMDKFGQMYVVKNPCRGTVRAFHKHDELWDYFHIVNGSAKFVLFKDKSKPMVFSLASFKPQLLVVPSGWFHGWMSLEDNTVLVSTANREYNKENPDEERISPDSLKDIDDFWKIKFK